MVPFFPVELVEGVEGGGDFYGGSDDGDVGADTNTISNRDKAGEDVDQADSPHITKDESEGVNQNREKRQERSGAVVSERGEEHKQEDDNKEEPRRKDAHAAVFVKPIVAYNANEMR